MKKALLTLAAIGMVGSSYAQGTITFQYFGGGTGENPITLPNGTPADASYKVGLFLTSNLTAPLAVTDIFQNTGLFQYSGSDVIIPGVLPNTSANLTVRAWQASAGSYANSPIRGEQSFTTQPLGGNNPNPPPPAFPSPDLTGPGALGFSGMQLTVPEPSTYALGIAGLGALAMMRRRK